MAGPYYVRSGAGGAGTGADWTNAYTTLATALSGKAAGDVFYIADDHAESNTGAVTFTSPGTAQNPIRILCVNTHVTIPPTGLATSATITVGATSGNMTFGAGYAYVYGISFLESNGAVAGDILFQTTGSGWELDTGKLTLANTSTTSRIRFGSQTAGSEQCYVRLNNTTMKFGSTSQTIVGIAVRFYWQNTPTAIDSGGSIPTILYTLSAQSPGLHEFSSVDFVQIASGKTLIAQAAAPHRVLVRNCKLGSSFTILSGTIGGPNSTEIYADNCDSGNVNYFFQHYKFQGSIKQEATIVKTSGASDGTTPISHKFVSLTNGPTLFSPLEGPWMLIWIDSTGSKTFTVDIIHDNVTNLKDSEVWLEIEYLGDASFIQGSFANDRVADALATAADQTSSSATWTTTGLTNPNKQKLEVTATINQKGLVRARVMLAKANYTIYADPQVQVSGITISRSYLVQGGPYVNELSTGSGGLAANPLKGFMG